MKTKKPRFVAKILALVLSLLMLLGAMPVAFAADGDIVIKWPTAAREIEYGQTVADAGLNNDGEATVDGHFEYTYPTDKPGVGVSARDAKFIPDDINIAPVEGFIDVITNQSKSVKIEGGVPTATAIQAGQNLSDSVIDRGGTQFYNYGTIVNIPWKLEWKEPTKVMNTAGVSKETVVCSPMFPIHKGQYASVEVDIDVVVEGDASETVIVAELPKASQIEVGQTLADSTLTGGLVTKGGNPVAGTFAWKDSTIAPKAGTRDYTVVFTSDDSSVCEPQEMQVSVTTVRPEMKLTWPEVKGQYKAGGYVDDCVTLTGGEANVPGKFGITLDYIYKAIPKSITEPMDIELYFVPDDKVNYEEQRKAVTVTFEPANPDCEVTLNVLSETQIKVNSFIKNEENWDIKTGKLYFVLDGNRIELDRYSKSFVYDATTIAPGTHTVQTIYEQGADDYYVSNMSDVQEFNIKAIYAVNVSDSAGDKVLGSYLPGKTVTVTAAPHEKSYYDFTGWTAEGITLTEEEAAQQKISFTMPENEVKLTANYKFNFKNFVKYVFEQIGVKLMALVMQGIEWIKGLLP